MKNKINKAQIVNSFNRAATSYNQANFLQLFVGSKMFSGLSKFNNRPKKIVDLGCGTGTLTEKLAILFSDSNVLGIDIADQMIRQAEKKIALRENLRFICADADNLPLKDNSVDLIFSNLMMQWSPDIEITLQELWRVLASHGYLFFSTLGPESLQELRKVWSKIDSYTHVNNFITQDELSLALTRANFKYIEFASGCYYRTFYSIYDLLMELKMLGAHNINPERRRGLLGKNKFKQFKKYYNCYQTIDKKFPITFEIYYVYAIKKSS